MAHQISILLVDDAPESRVMLKRLLTAGGFEIAGEAGTGTEAVGMVRDARPDAVVVSLEEPVVPTVEVDRSADHCLAGDAGHRRVVAARQGISAARDGVRSARFCRASADPGRAGAHDHQRGRAGEHASLAEPGRARKWPARRTDRHVLGQGRCRQDDARDEYRGRDGRRHEAEATRGDRRLRRVAGRCGDHAGCHPSGLSRTWCR